MIPVGKRVRVVCCHGKRVACCRGQAVLRAYPAATTMLDVDNNTPMHWAARSEGAQEIVRATLAEIEASPSWVGKEADDY